MIQAFLVGFITKATTSNTFNTAIGGRVYDTEGPEGATYPYAVITNTTAIPSHTFSTNVYEMVFTFNIFSNTRANTEIDELFDKFTALMEPSAGSGWVAITVSGYAQVMYRMSNWFRFRADDTWQYTIELTARIQKN